jgi:hypothetical protein
VELRAPVDKIGLIWLRDANCTNFFSGDNTGLNYRNWANALSAFFLEEGDITRQETEAILQAANSRMAGGGGVEGDIHCAAGQAIMEECRRVGECHTWQAVITTGGAGLQQLGIYSQSEGFKSARRKWNEQKYPGGWLWLV